MKLEQILAFLRQLRRLPAVYYIGGSEILPPPLSPEEEAAAAAACQAGDEGARRTLIEHNLRLVVFLARKFESSGVGTEDLISIGTIGLIKAVSTYRSDRKVKLATYASRCIENEILMYLRKVAGRRAEVSFDEPLSSDWDGNELLLSDILGTEPDSVMRPLEDDVDRALLLRALSRMAWNSVPVQLMNVVNGSAMLVARSTAAPVSTRPPSLGLSMRTIHGAAAAMITASAVRADILAAQQKRNALFSRAWSLLPWA